MLLLLASLDASQPSNVFEKVELLAHIVSGLVPRTVGSLLLVLHHKESPLSVFPALLPCITYYLLGFKNEQYSLVSSAFASIFVPVLVKADVSKIERLYVEDLKYEDKKTIQRTQGLLSIINISIFQIMTLVLVSLDRFSDVNLSIDPKLIFVFVFLPGCILATFCSLMLSLFPSVKMNEKFNRGRSYKLLLDLIIIITTIVISVTAGMRLHNPEQHNSFVLVKVRRRRDPLTEPVTVFQVDGRLTLWTPEPART